MYQKSLIVLVSALVVGCGSTPSNVHLGERRFNRINAAGEEVPAVVAEGRFYYADPMTTMAAEGQMLWNYELAKSLEAVRTATNDDELELAKRQLAVVQAAKPTGPEKVKGQIINYTARDLVCVVYADASKTKRHGRVVLPAAVDAGGSVRPFTLAKGINAMFSFTENGVLVNEYVLQNPAEEDWQAWIK